MANTIIGLASIAGAIGTLIGALYALYKIMKKFETIDALKKENTLIIKSVFAICDGLKQLGANGAVSKARDELQDYIIKN